MTIFFLKNFFSKNKIFIIRGSGIDLKYYKKTSEPTDKKITIGYVGRMLEDKGIHWLIEGFQQALKQKNLVLFLAGP